MEDQFLTVKEAAEYVRLKPLALYRMVERKKIPFRRAGRSIRFLKEELDTWLSRDGVTIFFSKGDK